MVFSPFKLFRQLIGRKAIPLNRVNALLKVTCGGGVRARALMGSRKRPTINRDGLVTGSCRTASERNQLFGFSECEPFPLNRTRKRDICATAGRVPASVIEQKKGGRSMTRRPEFDPERSITCRWSDRRTGNGQWPRRCPDRCCHCQANRSAMPLHSGSAASCRGCCSHPCGT